jgi:integrase
MRHRSGRYYARAYVNGKDVWEPLNTSHFSVAEAKCAQFMRQHRKRPVTSSTSDAKMTFGAALAHHLRVLKDKSEAREIKSSTLHYWEQIFRALGKSWPDLERKQIRRITQSECQAWAAEAKKSSSPTRFNNALDGLRHVIENAVDDGIIYRNPVAKIERLTVRKKQLTLPSVSNFAALVVTIAAGGGWCSADCADFVKGLAYTGMRKSEAAQLEWRDLLFRSAEIDVRGDPETGTKNWEIRRVPMIPEARELFQRMRAARAAEPDTAGVFRVHESQKAIDAACRKLKIARITHHDLRHLFATTCIEVGIDIPTVSRWLGHKDGGALAMKTYGHLRDEHSAVQAERVRFAPFDTAAPVCKQTQSRRKRTKSRNAARRGKRSH